MIQLKCPRCGETVAAEVPPGQTLACPRCGNVNVVPANAAGLPSGGPVNVPPEARIEDKHARTWGMLCHLSALAGFVGVPFGFIVGPLIVWLIKGKEHPFIHAQGKEAVNFQITATIAAVAAGVLILAAIGVVLLPAVLIADLVFVILASLKANDGESYRYPVAIRFIK